MLYEVVCRKCLMSALNVSRIFAVSCGVTGTQTNAALPKGRAAALPLYRHLSGITYQPLNQSLGGAVTSHRLTMPGAPDRPDPYTCSSGSITDGSFLRRKQPLSWEGTKPVCTWKQACSLACLEAESNSSSTGLTATQIPS